MKRKLLHIIYSLTLIAMWHSCTDQRDLYVKSGPVILIKSDWEPSRISTDDGASLMIFPLPNYIHLLDNPFRTTKSLEAGGYDMLIFNGYMFSETETHLDNIYYNGSDNIETFEAVVTEKSGSEKFRAKQGEIIVNNPDTLSTRSSAKLSVEGTTKYEVKYKDGHNGFPTSSNYIEDSLEFTPCRVTHNCIIKVHAINIKAINGRGIVKASLRGFAGSVFLYKRLPSHTEITHQCNLNGLIYDADSPLDGTIGATFSTFGPPLDLPERTYELEINVKYPSGNEARFVVDVTDQIKPIIARMNQERLDNKPIMDDIVINTEITIENDNGGDFDIDVEEWGDDVIVTIPF